MVMKYSLFNGKEEMQLMKNSEVEKSWKNLIYPPKQLGDFTLDLTVKKIFSFKNQGVLDFGGSEYQPAELEPLLPKIEEDPKYGWWTLSKGRYMVEYNEILLRKNCMALVYPHQRLQMTGCFHAPFIIKLGIGGMVIGMVVILFSVIRDRFKEVSSEDVGGKY